MDRKGKPAEKRGRKAAGLNPDLSGQDSRAAEDQSEIRLRMVCPKAFSFPVVPDPDHRSKSALEGRCKKQLIIISERRTKIPRVVSGKEN
jgi:hypothetical protein